MSEGVELVEKWRCHPGGGGVPLFLHRKAREGGKPVLLIHGASAKHESFTFPPSLPGRARNLTDWLHAHGFDVWLLDWRASARVVEAAREDGTLEKSWHSFDLDHAARYDVPEALEKIASKLERPLPRVGFVAHCLGSAVLAQAIAQGHVDARARPTRVVLQTLGLFYDAPPESVLKSQDHAFERMLVQPQPPLAIDPHHEKDWPEELRDFYGNWRARQHPADERDQPRDEIAELCNRISFLYGPPYLERNLCPAIHHATAEIGFSRGRVPPALGDVVRGTRSRASGVLDEILDGNGSWEDGDRTGILVARRLEGRFDAGEPLEIAKTRVATCTSVRETPPELGNQFGGIPFKLYAHGARNLRRGWAAPFDARAREAEEEELVGAEARGRFHALECLLLLTGERNSLWHPRSIHRMREWLLHGSNRPVARCERRVLGGYGHQDLLWGRRASEDVFPLILRALG